MWIVTTSGFISLVEDRNNSKMLQVRARVRKDIEKMFPSAIVKAVDGADYRYRARISKEKVASVMSDMILNDLTYQSHFKDVALAKDKGNASRRTAYYAAWNAFSGMQDYAPYSHISRKEETARRAKYTTAGTNTGYGHAYRSQTGWTTADDDQWWRKHVSNSPSVIDALEAAKEPEVWENDWVGDPDLPDDDFMDGDVYHDDVLPFRGELDEDELDAVEEAFGVEPSTINEETLRSFIEQLRSMHYFDNQPPRARRGERRRKRRKER